MGLALALAAVSACGTPPPAAVTPMVLVGPAPTVSASAEAAAEAAPDALARPAAVACTLHAKEWSDVGFRLRVEGPVYATFGAGMVRVTAPVGPAALGFFGEVELEGFAMAGLVTAGDLVLHPARTVTLEGVLRLKPGARLRWVEGTAEGLRVRYEPDVTKRGDLVEQGLVARSGSIDAIGCGEASIVVGSFDPRPQGVAASAPPMAVKAGDVQVRAMTAGARSVTIRVAKDREPTVDVLETRGALSNIVWELSDAVAVGWVDSGALQAVSPVGYGSGRGWLGGYPDDRPPLRAEPLRVCKRDLPLSAELGGVRLVVGTLRAGTAVRALEQAGALRHIAPADTRAITLQNGARWLVAADALAKCAEETRSPRVPRPR
jgi:hypothetical protein